MISRKLSANCSLFEPFLSPQKRWGERMRRELFPMVFSSKCIIRRKCKGSECYSKYNRKNSPTKYPNHPAPWNIQPSEGGKELIRREAQTYLLPLTADSWEKRRKKNVELLGANYVVLKAQN